MPIYATLGATNLAQNPDFEEARAFNDYWSPYSSHGNYTSNSLHKWSGNNSYKYEVTSLGAYIGFYSPSVHTDARRILVTPGLLYSGAFRIMGDTGVLAKTAFVGMHFKDAASATVAELQGPEMLFQDDKWYLIKWEGVEAPIGAEFVEFRLFANHSSSGFAYDPVFVGESFYIDGADFRQSATIDNFVAGNQGANFGWNGTPHRSTSYRNATLEPVRIGKGGLIKITPELFKADKLNNLGDDISEVIKLGSVEMRSDRSIKFLFHGQLTMPEEINPYTDYFAPYLTVEKIESDPVREQVGLYSTAPMKETLTYVSRTAQIEGADLSWNLSDSTFSGYYSIPAGANYVTEVVKILLSEGFTRYVITPTEYVLPANRTWKADVSKLTIINDLLESIGYYSIHADRYGIFRSFPYKDLALSEPGEFYFSGQGSTVIGVLEKEPLIENIYNYVKIIKEDQSDPTNSFVYELVNENDLSPTSIPNLGRTRFLAINDTEILNESVAAAKAKQIIQDSASLYTKYTMTTLPDPSRNVWEIYDVNLRMKNNAEALVGRVRVSGWDIGFTPSTAKMAHYIHRMEPI